VSTIKNNESVTGAAYQLLFDAEADGGPARAVEIENTGDSEGTAQVLVAPVHRLATATPPNATTGLYMAVGAKKEFVGVVNGEPSISKVWVRPLNAAHTLDINLCVTAR
jgi:hypothetical protein